jgi:hypothetical protein
MNWPAIRVSTNITKTLIHSSNYHHSPSPFTMYQISSSSFSFKYATSFRQSYPSSELIHFLQFLSLTPHRLKLLIYCLMTLPRCWLWSLIIFLIQRSLFSVVFIPHEYFTPQKNVHSSTWGSVGGVTPPAGG